MEHIEKRIFISHSSEDILLGNAFVSLIQTGMGASEDEIFHTLKSGQGIGSRQNTIEAIDKVLKASEIVIVLITPNYLSSIFCMIQYGSIEGSSKKYIPVLFPPISPEDEEFIAVFNPNVQAIRANCKDELDKLYGEVRPHIAKPNCVATWNKNAIQFMQKIC